MKCKVSGRKETLTEETGRKYDRRTGERGPHRHRGDRKGVKGWMSGGWTGGKREGEKEGWGGERGRERKRGGCVCVRER